HRGPVWPVSTVTVGRIRWQFVGDLRHTDRPFLLVSISGLQRQLSTSWPLQVRHGLWPVCTPVGSAQRNRPVWQLPLRRTSLFVRPVRRHHQLRTDVAIVIRFHSFHWSLSLWQRSH